MIEKCKMQNEKCRIGILFAGAMLWAINAFSATVMCDSNGAVYYPANFWQVSGAEEMMLDIAEATAETHTAGLLSDYYTSSQSDGRFKAVGDGDYAHNILVDRTNLSVVAGYDVQSCFDSIDMLLTNLVAQTAGISTNGTNTTIVIGGSTNAADIRVAFTPTEYSPATNSVESHLIAINSRLGYLLGLITNIAAPTSTVFLTGMTLTGNNLVYETSTNRFYLSATYSDSSSRDVSGESVYSLASGPATAQMVGTNLVIGSITWNTSVTVNAEYSWNGTSLSRSALVQVNDTNPPTLQSVAIAGTSSIGERTPAMYTAFAVYDQGVSNNVSATATWGFSTAYPLGTAWTGNTLYAGSTLTNYAIGLTAQSGGKTGAKTVTVVNTEQHLLFTFNNSGAYSSGTLHLEGYDNRMMSGFPVWKTSMPYTPAMYGAWSTNILSTTIRNTGYGQYTGNTWWWAWIDTDGNGILNGTFVPASSPIVTMRNDEPGAIAYNQTASTGPALAQNTSTAIRFDLTDQRYGYARQGWTTAQMIGPKYNVVINSAGGTRVGSYAMTNRTYICDQDMLTSAYGPITISSGMFVYVSPPGQAHVLWGGFVHDSE